MEGRNNSLQAVRMKPPIPIAKMLAKLKEKHLMICIWSSSRK
jgi:hypothetical protein